MGSASDAEPLVRLRHVSRSFPPHVQALRDATFTIAEGQSIAITGPSGSGKSTLLSIIGLLDWPTSGEYLLGGVDVTQVCAARQNALRRDCISFVFQAFHLIEHLTVIENVLYGLSIKKIRGPHAKILASSALERVGLMEKSKSYPAHLSGGERQRVAIARAIACPPRLLLCDEPTGNLDSANSSNIIDLLHDTVSDSTALVIVTHDEGVAQSCQRWLEVRDGFVSEVLP